GFRACLGVIRLVKGFGRERVNAACGRALEINARTYGYCRLWCRRLSKPRGRRRSGSEEVGR
ncbi:IS21 family transposase, partial [Mesorhizobium sp. M3A.F.Ca.ET.175.01.1.1]